MLRIMKIDGIVAARESHFENEYLWELLTWALKARAKWDWFSENYSIWYCNTPANREVRGIFPILYLSACLDKLLLIVTLAQGILKIVWVGRIRRAVLESGQRAKVVYTLYLISSMTFSRVGLKCGIQNDSLLLLSSSMCSTNGTRTANNACPISRIDQRVPKTRSDRRA
jgi:hypothetical protein